MPLYTGQNQSFSASGSLRKTTISENISIRNSPRVDQRTAGITTTITGMQDMSRFVLANNSGGNCFLNHNVIRQGTTYNAPVIIEDGEVHPFVWYREDNAFRY